MANCFLMPHFCLFQRVMNGLCCPDLNFTMMSIALDILLPTPTGKPNLFKSFDDCMIK